MEQTKVEKKVAELVAGRKGGKRTPYKVHLTTADCARNAGLTTEQADRFLRTVLEGLRNVGEVHLVGFGQFRITQTGDMKGLRAGRPVQKVIRFSRSRIASAFVNGKRED